MVAFVAQSRLVYSALFYWLYPWGYVSNVVLAPFFQLLTFSLVATYATGAESAQRYMVGMITWAIVWIVISGILQSFAYDRGFGTLSLLFATPVSRLAALASRAALHFPNGVISALVTIALAALFADLDVSSLDWGTAAAAVVMMSLACTTLGLVLGCWTALTQDWFVSNATSHALLITLTGVLVPTADLPPIASDVGVLLPLTHGVEALRQAFIGASIADVRGELVREGLVALAYGVGSYVAFRLLERHARRSGALELAG